MRALPVAAGTNEGGHYFKYFCPILTGKWANFEYIPETLILELQIFAWAPKSQKYKDSKGKKIRGPPLPP